MKWHRVIRLIESECPLPYGSDIMIDGIKEKNKPQNTFDLYFYGKQM